MSKKSRLKSRGAADARTPAGRAGSAARVPGNAPSRAQRLPAWTLFILVGLVTFCVFLPSLRAGFVDWDDHQYLLENLSYRGLGPVQLRWMWTSFLLGIYQPLSWMTYGLDYLVWGMRPAGYHLTAVLLHALAAVIFAAVAARLMRRKDRPPWADGREALIAAAFGALAALTWSVHPLRVEAVTWATERREVLCGTLSLLAVFIHLTGRRALTVLVAAAAMASKATAVVLPLLLVLVDLHQEAPLRWSAWIAAARRSVIRHAAVFGLAVLFGILAMVAAHHAENVATLERLGLGDRLALFANGIGLYAFRSVWPFSLAPLYEMTGDLSQVRLGAAVSAASLLGVLVFAIVRRSRDVLLLLLAYVVPIVPVGGLVQVGRQIAADRYAYQPGWALSLLAAAGVAAVLLRLRVRAPSETVSADGVSPLALLAAAVVLGVPLALLTVRQQRIWHDSVSLWTHQLAVYPETATAHYSLARLKVTNEPGEASDRWAEPHYREALRIRPDYADAYRGLGNSLRRLGRRDEAIRVYEDGLKVAPRSGPLLYGLAIADWESGRRADSIVRLRELSELPPVTADSHLVLARALAAHGDPAGATAAYERAMAASTDSPAIAPMELSWLLATNPDPRVRDGYRAVMLARRAVDLGRALEAQGGLELRSGISWRLPRTLAAALAESGDYEGAAGTLRESAALFPPDRRPEIEAWLAGFARGEPVRAEPVFP